MKRLSTGILLAIAAAIGGSEFIAQAQLTEKIPLARPGSADVTPPASDKLPALLPADAKTAGDVRDMLAATVNDSLTEKRFRNLVMHLSSKDRERIGEMPKENFDELDKAIAQFRADFKNRYNQEFDFKPEMLKDTQINQGQDKDVVLITLSGPQKVPAVNPAPAAEISPPLKPSGNLKELPGETGMNAVSGPAVKLTNEGRPGTTAAEATLWRINIPNEITGRQIKENLTRHLQKLDDLKSVWTDDPNATYRAAASEVFQAIYDSTLASEQ